VLFFRPARALVTSDLFWNYPRAAPGGTQLWKFGMDQARALTPPARARRARPPALRRAAGSVGAGRAGQVLARPRPAACARPAASASASAAPPPGLRRAEAAPACAGRAAGRQGG